MESGEERLLLPHCCHPRAYHAYQERPPEVWRCQFFCPLQRLFAHAGKTSGAAGILAHHAWCSAPEGIASKIRCFLDLLRRLAACWPIGCWTRALPALSRTIAAVGRRRRRSERLPSAPHGQKDREAKSCKAAFQRARHHSTPPLRFSGTIRLPPLWIGCAALHTRATLHRKSEADMRQI